MFQTFNYNISLNLVSSLEWDLTNVSENRKYKKADRKPENLADQQQSSILDHSKNHNFFAQRYNLS